MLISYQLGQTSIILRVKLRQDTTGAKPGDGITGLTISSSGLIISTIADNEASPTVYTQAGSTIETVATLGTYAAPTATKCRFKLVDNINHPGVYEIQLADARFAVANAKSLLISIIGVSGLADCDVLIPLTSVNPYSAAFGLTLAKTTNITGFNDIAASAIVSGGAIATSGGAATIDGTSPLAESYSTTTLTVAQALYEIAQCVGQFSIAGTTLTMQKRDGSTQAAAYTLDSATNPTSRSRTA